ncbi:MAG: hypothetical protein KAG43_08690, partial [Candidatus Marithrix sp.]|nr:hypothetical protein [Candidatus Marithrix sp.]
YDSWGNPIRYRLDDAHGDTTFPDSLTTTSKLKIRDRDNNHLTNESVNSSVIAVIYSCGKNGKPDEENDKHSYHGANCSPSFATTTKETFTQDGYVENKFDDILTWIPKTKLINQLVLAGKWPP